MNTTANPMDLKQEAATRVIDLETGFAHSRSAEPVIKDLDVSAVWEMLPECRFDSTAIDRRLLVAIDRSDPAHLAFDMLRTRIIQALREKNWTSVAITSPSDGCGKTLTAINLAFSLSHQSDCRTLLMDFDFRRPSIGSALALKPRRSLEGVLRSDVDIADAAHRYSKNLAIAVNDRTIDFAAELLQGANIEKALAAIRKRLNPDIILFDLPPMLANDDVTAFLPSVDSALLVVRSEITTREDADACESGLSRSTNVLGIVLNDCRSMPSNMNY
jgi:protein-tyrosine kinase